LQQTEGLGVGKFISIVQTVPKPTLFYEHFQMSTKFWRSRTREDAY